MPAIQGTCRIPGSDPWIGKILWIKEMATHSSILAWEIPRTEEPGMLQSMGSQRIRHNLVTKQQPQQRVDSLCSGTSRKSNSLCSLKQTNETSSIKIQNSKRLVVRVLLVSTGRNPWFGGEIMDNPIILSLLYKRVLEFFHVISCEIFFLPKMTGSFSANYILWD